MILIGNHKLINMNIDNLNERWFSLEDDANKTLIDAIRAHGGAYYFITENDERLDKIDDLSELELPLVDAYTYYRGKQGTFYMTSVVLGEHGLNFYGVDERSCLDITETIQLDHIPLSGILDILEH